MVKAREVIALCGNKGWVSVAEVVQAFGVSPERACEIIKACWDKGLLLPVDRAWFTPPAENGGPVLLTGPGGAQNREKWYRDEIAQLLTAFEEDETLALTVNDAAKRFNLHPNKARKVLNFMVEQGKLVSQESPYGGAFGRKPIIYSTHPDNIHGRAVELKAQKKKTGPKPGQKKREAQANAPHISDGVESQREGRFIVDFGNDYD